MKITNYATVKELAANRLVATVQEWITSGWQPYGNPYVHYDYFYQAMVKYQENRRHDQYLHDTPEGWFFEDETGSLEGNGPFKTRKDALDGLDRHVINLNR